MFPYWLLCYGCLPLIFDSLGIDLGTGSNEAWQYFLTKSYKQLAVRQTLCGQVGTPFL